jgi:hypothetical protein
MMTESVRVLTTGCRAGFAPWLRAAGLALGVVAASAALGADDTSAPPASSTAGAPASDAPAPPPSGATAPSPSDAAAQPGSGTAAPPPGGTATPSANEAEPPASEFSNLDNRIENTKSEVIQLNRDLMVLEEELLFPANTQVAVFVSMDVGKLFDLDSVQVKLDDKEVANYLYTPFEVQALHRGGVQRIYLGNLKAGSHELVAFFTGGGPHRRDYRRGTTVKFDKGTDPKYVELRIKDSTGKLQPEFDVKIWPGPLGQK